MLSDHGSCHRIELRPEDRAQRAWQSITRSRAPIGGEWGRWDRPAGTRPRAWPGVWVTVADCGQNPRWWPSAELSLLLRATAGGDRAAQACQFLAHPGAPVVVLASKRGLSGADARKERQGAVMHPVENAFPCSASSWGAGTRLGRHDRSSCAPGLVSWAAPWRLARAGNALTLNTSKQCTGGLAATLNGVPQPGAHEVADQGRVVAGALASPGFVC